MVQRDNWPERPLRFIALDNPGRDAFESKSGAPVAVGDSAEPSTARQFSANTPPDLTHTKVLAIEFDGKPLARGEANWNGLLNAAIRAARAKAKSTDELKKLVVVNIVAGRKFDEGYRFLSDIGISVQGQDANGAWRVAQRLGCKLKATFIWREKEGAAFLGTTGQVHIGGRA
jgi:hypothetical protein